MTDLNKHEMEILIKKVVRECSPSLFRKSDGNGGTTRNWRAIWVGVIGSLITFVIIGAVSAGFNRVMNMERIETKLQALADYMDISATLNDMQSDRINEQTEAISDHLHWNPCPQALPHVKDLKGRK